MTTTELTALLDALGSTPSLVAQTLHNRGCRGYRLGVRCPVAVYLRQHLGAAVVLTVSGLDVGVTMLDGATVEVSTPAAVRDFILSFDRGQHPELDLERT